eukprot:TRINITY_DN18507_c0_g1_i2.p1 TRINITY_DN18507_c0_g1~~TRINITY_DN18507_c0_g1_i2.p1  ORF type:complete len:302 (-),score=17.72 TRINITY_DN18507_c0_g1_i2:4-909(-)
MIRRPPRSTQGVSSAASDVYKRQLSNSIETSFLLIAYYYWGQLQEKFGKYDCLVAVLYTITFLIRPTAGIIIGTLVVFQLYKFGKIGLFNLLKAFLFGAVPILVCAFAIDSWYFGSPQYTMWNFAKLNFFSGISKFYGVHSTLWYITSGIPYLLLTYLPFTAYGLYRLMSREQNVEICYISVVYLTLMSLLAHKEDRFLMPILPYLLMMAGYCLQSIRKASPKLGLGLLLFSVITQFLALGIFNSVYRVGSLKIMDELRDLGEQVDSVYFFTDCHATPFYSHLHRDIKMDFPACPPPCTLR